MTLALAFSAPSAPTLRPYQVDAIAAVQARWEAGDRGTLLVLATGLGKTVCFAELARLTVTRGHRALVLAHRTELLEQAAAKLAAIGVDAAIEQGPKQAGRADVVVASVQTLRGARLQRWAPDAFDLVIVDEAHHSAATTYRAILDHFATARVLGVTATPDRGDGQGLGDFFQSVAFKYDLGDDAAARREGRPSYLAPIVARRIRLDVDLDRVKTTRGDLDQAGLAKVMTDPAVLEASARAIVEQAGTRTCILFTAGIEHAHLIAEALNQLRPGFCRAVSGETPKDERAQILAALARGELQAVSNDSVLTEGFDCSRVAMVAMLRPTKVRALYVQMLGRGTRLDAAKDNCLALDFVGLTGRHRLVSSVDVLAGDIDANLAKAAAERTEREAIDIDQAIADARAEIEAARRAPTYRWLVEDVGELLDIDLDERLLGDGFAPATEWQRLELADKGFKAPPGLTELAAGQVIAAIERRRKSGLCSVKQVRFLVTLGIPRAEAIKLTSSEAGIAIPQLKPLLGRSTALLRVHAQDVLAQIARRRAEGALR